MRATSGSSRWTVACPRPTPATSSTELVGPVGSVADPDPQVTRTRHGAHPAGATPHRGWDADAVRIPVVWSPDTRRHVPRHEVWVGVPTPGTELPERVDVDPRRPSPEHPRHEATPHDDELLRRPCTTRVCSTSSAGAAEEWARGPYDELVGQDRVVPYFFPTDGAARRHGADRRRPRCTPGPGGYCYDTMTLVGPGTWEAARAAVDVALTAVDLVVAGERSGVRALPAAGPPRHAARVRRLLLPQQRRRRRGGAARGRPRAGRGRSTSTPTTATAPRRCSGSGRTSSTARCTSTPRPAGSRTSSGTRARPAPAPGPGTTRNLPLPEGTGDGPWVDGGRPARRLGVATARRWSSRSASTPPATTRRARCRSPPTGSARPARSLGGLGLPSVLVQEGGYDLATMGGLVAAYLSGHAQGPVT